ncbi:hypothetical protein QBC35DRAFT_515135 [Podospora australis]|uniref:RGS domain-containing protein n=1 Tax=Podospora australis TaxID=1536484 RepID=A0AAN6WTX6_9PEZI|nr:hypothetical protein QBC35DRAFT_515135 [Podospora australis]
MIFPRESPKMLGSEFGTTPDTKPEPRLNGIGIWWITYGAVQTAALVAGMCYLYSKRRYPTLRLRGLALTFAGLILLHLYWITVQIGYTVGPLAPEVAEFWIMSIWYPFGVALFQAGNSQFLHVAKAQSRFARPPSETSLNEKHIRWRQNTKQTIWQRLKSMDYQRRMFMFVIIGMAVQFFVVIIIYLISRKFHPDFGIPGTEVHGKTPMEIAMQQGRGWEWWPSLFWQFLWAWIFAPIILWRSRGIRDTHGWQLQTMASCIAGLHAAPMWLIALYVPAMAPVNAYFIPPQWIALSITIMEIFTVFIPCYQVYKAAPQYQAHLDHLKEWERKKKFGGGSTSEHTDTTATDSAAITFNSITVRDPSLAFSDGWKDLESGGGNSGDQIINSIPADSLLTLGALEHVLSKNPEPLRQFSARKDFSGENIAFLTSVAEWKANLSSEFIRSRIDGTPLDDPAYTLKRREEFNRALKIYIEFISPRDAEFPINIDWPTLRRLEGVFERAARTILGDVRVNTALPFEASSDDDWKNPESRHSEAKIITVDMFPSPTPDTEMAEFGEVKDGLYTGDIPSSFDASIFNNAQESIKHLVLTNTWPKYVRERRNLKSISGHSGKSKEFWERQREQVILSDFLMP